VFFCKIITLLIFLSYRELALNNVIEEHFLQRDKMFSQKFFAACNIIASKGGILSVVIPAEKFFLPGANLIFKNAKFSSTSLALFFESTFC
jgi:hypothetical protein